MRLAFFDSFKLGVVQGDSVVDVSAAVESIPHAHPQDVIRGVIEQWDHYEGALAEAAERGNGVPVASVRFRPPLPRPANIDCMAVNYMENGTLPAPPPVNAFHKSPNSVIGDGDTMVLPDVPATIFEGEAELALVIGRRGTNVLESEAMSYIFGYMNFIDGSARGLQPTANGFYQMKSRDTFCPIGPVIVTADEVPDPQNLSIKLWNNGMLMQDFNTNDMAHKIPRTIEFVSSVHTIEPGDILATGTNHRGLNPFMDGDQIDVEVEGLGRLHFNVRDELKRTWERQTRLQRREAGLEGPTAPQLTGKYAPS
ncbi:MAG: fumarylacetoacetate hydrolase family protein [Acidimicrobiales bacterium]|nr:fumarylacetoacetate hydrolase family protein [Acidimicrobiales bacterium]MBO0893800.1 fumarylacetoacetate hydrolase family protein [Acidimicrobiales bacterium]